MPTSLIVSPSSAVPNREVFWPYGTGRGAQSPPYAFPAPTFMMRDTNNGLWTESQHLPMGSSNQVAGGGFFGVWSPPEYPGSLWAMTSHDPGGSRAYQLEGLGCQMNMLGAGLADGVSLPPIDRVYWLRIYLYSVDVNPIPVTSRIVICPSEVDGNPPRPSNVAGVGNKGGFGIAGDGAGQWQYVSYDRSGPDVLREQLPLPVHNIAQINCFEAVRINGSPGVDASWLFRWNGEDFINRDYTAGLLEPPLADELLVAPMVETSGAFVQRLNWRVHCSWGRFLPSGVEVF